MKSPMLESKRLILRRWKLSDHLSFHALNSDPSVMEFLPGMLTREQSDTMIAQAETHFEENGFGWWAVEVKTTGEMIGFTGLKIPKFEAHFTPCVEIGWRLAKSHWGKGYATEAARTALHFGFTELNLREIVSITVPANLRSIAVMERLKMTRNPNEDFDHPQLSEGDRLRRHILYRIVKDKARI